MWTADNTINVIRLILLGANVRKIQSFYIFFGKNFVNSMSERTRLGFFWYFFLQIICVDIQGCPPITPRGPRAGESPRTHNWVVSTVLVVSSIE